MPRARGYDPLAWTPEGAALVARIVARAAAAGPGHAAVLDLDGCLFDTRPRQIHIFRELAGQRGWPELARVEVAHIRDWSLRNALLAAGLDPVWVETHGPEIREFWERRFFRGEYVLHDHAMPGAPEFVRALHATGVHVVYLTGRDDRMREGTEAALRRFGFPQGVERATLLTKADPAEEDVVWKERALEMVATLGHVVLYLDNEPANVNLFRRVHPEALVVFVETDHSFRKDEPDPSIPWLRSFLRTPTEPWRT